MGNVFQKHQEKIAISTISMSKEGCSFMGGMNHQEAIDFLKSIGYTTINIKYLFEKAGHSPDYIKELFYVSST